MSEQDVPRPGGPLAAFLAMPNDSPLKTVTVATLLCLVCSLAVSGAAVMLKPLQERNKALAMKREILRVADLLEPGMDVHKTFERSVQTRLVDLSSGRYAEDMDPRGFDQRAAARDPATSTPIPPGEDIAGIKRRARYAPVYLIREAGRVRLIILPVHGYGLWSTMYGLLALHGDGSTIQGITFYEQGETAGLGAEIENPRWQAQWRDKRIYGPGGKVRFRLVKGGVPPSSPDAPYQVDALSGATLTSTGVTRLIQYWLGEQGFARFLARFRAQEGAT